MRDSEIYRIVIAMSSVIGVRVILTCVCVAFLTPFANLIYLPLIGLTGDIILILILPQQAKLLRIGLGVLAIKEAVKVLKGVACYIAFFGLRNPFLVLDILAVKDWWALPFLVCGCLMMIAGMVSYVNVNRRWKKNEDEIG